MIALDLARALDPVLMMQDAGVTPDPWQADLLRLTSHSVANPVKRVLMLCARQTGKTETAAGMALHRALYEDAALIVCVSPSQDQSDELLRRIKQLHGNLAGVSAMEGESVRRITFKNGSRIRALSANERTIRGISGLSMIIIDEAARVEEDVLAAVLPMMATRPDATAVALSTPKGMRGWYYDAWNGTEDWHRVMVSATECPRISQEYLDEMLRKLGAQRFSEEFGLQFLDSNESVFPTHIIDRAFDAAVLPLWN